MERVRRSRKLGRSFRRRKLGFGTSPSREQSSDWRQKNINYFNNLVVYIICLRTLLLESKVSIGMKGFIEACYSGEYIETKEYSAKEEERLKSIIKGLLDLCRAFYVDTVICTEPLKPKPPGAPKANRRFEDSEDMNRVAKRLF